MQPASGSPNGPGSEAFSGSPRAALLMIGGITALLAVVAAVVLGLIAWGGGDARAFVTRQFAEIRKDPRRFEAQARDAEARQAYQAIAASRGQSLPWLTESQGGGTPYFDMNTERCMNPRLSTGKRVGLVLRERVKSGKLTITIEGVSVQRECTCSGAEDAPCRLERP